MFATPKPVMLILTANYSYILLLSDLIFIKKCLRYRNMYRDLLYLNEILMSLRILLLLPL